MPLLPVESLGTTEHCGFAAFADDISTLCDIAFAKIRSRAQGTEMAQLLSKYEWTAVSVFP